MRQFFGLNVGFAGESVSARSGPLEKKIVHQGERVPQRSNDEFRGIGVAKARGNVRFIIVIQAWRTDDANQRADARIEQRRSTLNNRFQRLTRSTRRDASLRLRRDGHRPSNADARRMERIATRSRRDARRRTRSEKNRIDVINSSAVVLASMLSEQLIEISTIDVFVTLVTRIRSFARRFFCC